VSNIRINWTLPTTRESGKPLAVTDIKYVRLELSANGVDFSPLNNVVPPAVSLLVTDLEPGTWTVRATVVDTRDRVSKSVIGAATIEDNSAPGVVTDLTLTVL